MKEELKESLKKLNEAVNNTQHDVNAIADFSLIKPTRLNTNNMEIYKGLIENIKRMTKEKNQLENRISFDDLISDNVAVPLELVLLQSKLSITEEMALYLDNIGLNLQKFVVDRGNFMYPLYYNDGIFYYRFMYDYNILLEIIACASKSKADYERNDINDFFAKQFIHMMLQLVEVHDLFNSKEYNRYLSLIDTPFKFWAFKDNLETFTSDSTSDQFVELFAYVYTRSEYGFDELDWDELDWLLNEVTERSNFHSNYVLNHIDADKDGYIKIYRGEGLKSTDIENARSWTWDKSVALKFANRFSQGSGTLHTAKVHVNDLLLCIGGNEKEVLVTYDVIELIDSKSV
ncbi:hypothetical protein ABC382_01035 [Lysinibacillus sp. 1P01SD]|uniref:hypothetical protein n=1 Tax=Lysinibacillus sp. 1P01SD TaxID=3132285 RepID=UPI00399F9C16